ncbi:hypothetical protein Q3G72_006750 [Acer saccharum]|nr:hypothetical protein Q3G72_006750 [Acer saccharum]
MWTIRHPTWECVDGNDQENLSFGAWLRASAPNKKWNQGGGSQQPNLQPEFVTFKAVKSVNENLLVEGINDGNNAQYWGLVEGRPKNKNNGKEKVTNWASKGGVSFGRTEVIKSVFGMDWPSKELGPLGKLTGLQGGKRPNVLVDLISDEVGSGRGRSAAALILGKWADDVDREDLQQCEVSGLEWVKKNKKSVYVVHLNTQILAARSQLTDWMQ